jgi:hypothetical protein
MCSDRELASLRFHWGSAYDVAYDRGQWRAVRQDTGETLTAPTAGELLTLIRENYRVRPVPR